MSLCLFARHFVVETLDPRKKLDVLTDGQQREEAIVLQTDTEILTDLAGLVSDIFAGH